MIILKLDIMSYPDRCVAEGVFLHHRPGRNNNVRLIDSGECKPKMPSKIPLLILVQLLRNRIALPSRKRQGIWIGYPSRTWITPAAWLIAPCRDFAESNSFKNRFIPRFLIFLTNIVASQRLSHAAALINFQGHWDRFVVFEKPYSRSLCWLRWR